MSSAAGSLRGLGFRRHKNKPKPKSKSKAKSRPKAPARPSSTRCC